MPLYMHASKQLNEIINHSLTLVISLTGSRIKFYFPVGLAFECQLMPKTVPTGDTDKHMDHLVTCRRVYDCKDET